jgi:hypothetical protein
MSTPAGDSPFMTPDELVRTAGHRGYRLWIIRNWGMRLMTDGAKTYPLPRWLPGGLMDSELVWSLMQYFFGEGNAKLLAPDFHLAPRID